VGTRPIQPPEDAAQAETWAKEQDAYVGAQTTDAFFVKHRRFQREAEYRFIWFAEGPRRDYLNIKCPSAVQFCERF